jgi:hypothetical protein
VTSNWASGFASSSRQLYLAFKIRIRQWGALPADRGPSVLITNHQHMDEGETIIARTMMRHPWKTVVMCNSRRTFETGFIAARLPWTARFTRGLNLSGLWSLFNILPIENHLFSRPLISLAEDLRAVHGDLPLDAILPEAILESLGLEGRKMSDLWRSVPDFMRAQGWVKVAQLKPPYRRETLEKLRATTERDVAQIVERVRAGATFYITPEGDFSHDGRLHPMRSRIVDALSPFAALWLCAIAYDPFRGRRLSMLYRVVPLPDGADVGTTIAAARPVTTSALLGTFLHDVRDAFTAADARRAVLEQLEALNGVFVDPELRQSPDTVVDEALEILCKSGTLVFEGETFRLTDRRGDPRFPHVPDMVVFQRNMLEETLASARRQHS